MEAGDTLPALTLEDDTGRATELTTFVGRPLVLFFYPKADTPGCTNEAKDFTAHAADFEALGVRVVGASPDKAGKQGKFRAKHELSMTLLADEETALAQACGVWVEKSMYGKTYMGVERSTFLFDAEGRCIEAWRKVKVKGHVEAVLKAARKHFG